ncbi:cytochrome P450 [Hyalangium sp.]|uniref:cytochrome P450 n=1 Tax=Hyalangium sp. TaxID=2028555 RepID=UPI002D6AF8BD|nr:cytochrome P450 [Hyalangium sp.]HYI02194.1 cytochrome P450 [Hyalangium sp.]
MSSLAGYDLSSDAFFRDPYPTLRQLQRDEPVYFWEPMKSWMLTRYNEVNILLRDSHFTSQRVRPLLSSLVSAAGAEEVEKMIAQWSRMLFFQDPPRHTRIRSIVNPGFTAGSIEALRPGVAATARQVLAAHRGRGEIDLAVDFADLVSLGTISQLFSIPEADRPQFRQWTADMLKPAGIGVSADEVSRRVVKSSKELFGYMEALVKERREKPGSDMVSRLIEGDAWDPELAGEVSIQCIQVLAAGYTTAANQITNAVLCFLKHPTELKRLREEPGLLKSAVEEVLRYEPAALTVNRLCMEATELGGRAIQKGEFVFGSIAAANRDPAVFPDGDRFDIGRKPGRHIAFGSGPHYCLGSVLTRLELEESLRALLELSDWEFGAQPYAYASFNLQDRGPKTLPMRFRASN